MDAAEDQTAQDAARSLTPFQVAIHAFCAEAAARACAVPCFSLPVLDCPVLAEEWCVRRYGRFEWGAVAGRFRLDTDATARCLSAVSAGACGYFDFPPPECFRVFAGTVADGQACLNPNECVSGSCSRPKGACPGTCEGWADQGSDCRTLRCDPATSYCNAQRKCTAYLAEGAVCDPIGDRCVTGEFCDDVTHRCVPGRAAGGHCVVDFSSQEQCAAGLLCATNVCRPPAESGKPCGGGEFPGCAGDLACFRLNDGAVTQSGLCGDRVAEGGTCLSDECQAGLTCVLDDANAGSSLGKCRRGTLLSARPPAADGESCNEPIDCASGVCLGGFCVRDCTLADLPK